MQKRLKAFNIKAWRDDAFLRHHFWQNDDGAEDRDVLQAAAGGEGMSAVFWIVIGAVVLAACCGNKKGTNTGSSGGQRKSLRIDHPHYYDADDYECSVCGARFRKQSMVCPHCGARFNGTKEDNTEFDEEMTEEEDWDEEEGL